MHFTYLLLLVFTLSYPLFKSFEEKINYVSKWKYLFPAIVSSAIFFIVWDVWFTRIGIWEFNNDYVLGYFLFGLPIEEWLFFFIVPFSCVFIYEVLNYFFKKEIFPKKAVNITIVVATILTIISIIYSDHLYTFITTTLLAAFLLLHVLVLRSNYLGRFYFTWLVCLIPFFFVNGVLTSMPVLIYNDSENMGIRLFSIPLEDVFYGMLNILQVITVYEWLKKRNTFNSDL